MTRWAPAGETAGLPRRRDVVERGEGLRLTLIEIVQRGSWSAVAYGVVLLRLLLSPHWAVVLRSIVVRAAGAECKEGEHDCRNQAQAKQFRYLLYRKRPRSRTFTARAFFQTDSAGARGTLDEIAAEKIKPVQVMAATGTEYVRLEGQHDDFLQSSRASRSEQRDEWVDIVVVDEAVVVAVCVQPDAVGVLGQVAGLATQRGHKGIDVVIGHHPVTVQVGGTRAEKGDILLLSKK